VTKITPRFTGRLSGALFLYLRINKQSGSIMINNTWKKFYDYNAPNYEKEIFTSNTEFETEFLLREIPLNPGMKVLDIGCGTGRHSVSLAAKGISMTGLDISAGQLAEAKKKAELAGVNVSFIEADASEFSLDEQFDAAICLCEGSFGLLSIDDDPLTHEKAILQNLAAVLKPGAPFLLNALNAFEIVRHIRDEDIASGVFDPYTLTHMVRMSDLYPDFDPEVKVKEKFFTPMELRLALENNGFTVDHIWGGTAGNWTKHTLSLDEIEMMAKCHRN
jgi:2-polyprenyl-3-methyl-5-hydroxy-6-metoxy-1,4-benzoquinol methylase